MFVFKFSFPVCAGREDASPAPTPLSRGRLCSQRTAQGSRLMGARGCARTASNRVLAWRQRLVRFGPEPPSPPTCWPQAMRALDHSSTSPLSSPIVLIIYAFLGGEFCKKKTKQQQHFKLVMSHECGTRHSCSEGLEEEEVSVG